jgi:hypothetical protein
MLPDATEVSAPELHVQLLSDDSSGDIFELFAGLVEAAVRTEAANRSGVVEHGGNSATMPHSICTL